MATHTHACQHCGEHYACTAPLERNDDGWPDPVCVTRKESHERFWQCEDCNAGRLPCDGCDGKRRGTFNDHHGQVMCEGCLTNEAEAAHERSLSAYYGGDAMTLNERCAEGLRQKREGR